MNLKHLRILGLAAGGLLLAPQITLADNKVCADLATCQAGISSQINFKVVIPAFIRFKLGDPAAATGANLEYTLVAADVGSNTAVSSTASTNHGGAGFGEVAVSILSNITSGVTFTADTTFATGGFGQTVAGSPSKPSWEDMTVATTNIAHPVSGIAGSSASAVTLGTAIYNKSDTWTFTYNNDRVLPAGTYQGSVIYTLTAP